MTTKAEQALNIYNEEVSKNDESTLRKRTIARFKAELEMGDAGASTYYQNTKKKASGEKVVHYRPKAKETVDNAPEKPVVSKPMWSRYDMDDGVVTAVDCFYSLEEAQQSCDDEGGYVIDREVNIGEKF
ncbi:hypothetical protein D3C80_670780 [compost metagenome]